MVIKKDVIKRSRNLEEIKEHYDKLVSTGQKPQVIYSKIEPIEKLIEKYKARWIMSSEFQNEMLPKLKEEVKKRFWIEPERPKKVDLKEELIKALKDLSPEERKTLLSFIDNNKFDNEKKRGNPSS